MAGAEGKRKSKGGRWKTHRKERGAKKERGVRGMKHANDGAKQKQARGKGNKTQMRGAKREREQQDEGAGGTKTANKGGKGEGNKKTKGEVCLNTKPSFVAQLQGVKARKTRTDQSQKEDKLDAEQHNAESRCQKMISMPKGVQNGVHLSVIDCHLCPLGWPR